MTTIDQTAKADKAVWLPPPSQITVQYERKFSDGNYGSEGLSFSVTSSVNHDYFTETNCAEIARALREAVLEELAKSAAPRVAAAAAYELTPPKPTAQPAVAGAPEYEDKPF